MAHDSALEMLLTMAVAISAGVLVMVLSRALRTSAIALLLLGGVLLGPEVLNIVRPDSLGQGLSVLVSLAVSLILFEGGLTLDLKGYRSAERLIRRLLTIGVLITWLATALVLRLLYDFDWEFALLSASLVIVTGPTVVAPLLKRIRVKHKLQSILYWEGVLIDPIGVFVAILCFEWISGHSGGTVLFNFALRFAVGLAVGLVGGLGITFCIKHRWVPEEMINIFALACALLIFGLAEYLGGLLGFSEAGLLSVVISGFVLGWFKPSGIKHLLKFKGEITELMIGMLFILLAANLDVAHFTNFGLKGALAVGAVLLIVRPLNVLASSTGCDLSKREKLFLSWVAPRGIVAASMASLFAISLEERSVVANPSFVETFTYSIIVSTVILQGFTAGPLASLLKLKQAAPTGWLIVGAHLLARQAGRFIQRVAGSRVVLVDLNPQLVAGAKSDGLMALRADALDRGLEERLELQEIGNLLALTDNEDLNALACQQWAETFGKENLFRWHSSKKRKEGPDDVGQVVWSRFPKPSLLSVELARGEDSAMVLEQLMPFHEEHGSPLISLHQGAVVIDPMARDDVPKQEWGETLFLRRDAEYLARSFRPELFTRLEATDIQSLFKGLVEVLVRAEPTVSRTQVLEELLERERLFPTALGHNFAIPHAYCSELGSRICIVAKIPEGVDMEAPDRQPVHIVFMLVSPPGDPEGHLATLAEIARLGADKSMLLRLLRAESGGDLEQILADFYLMESPATRSAHSSS